MNSRAKRRFLTFRIIRRRCRLIKSLGLSDKRIKNSGQFKKHFPSMHYKFSHYKTNNRGNYGAAMQYKPHDLRQICREEDSL